MIRQPAPAVLAAADWTALGLLADLAAAKHAEGTLDAPAFAKLWADGLEASGGHPELLQTIDMFRPAGATRTDAGDWDENLHPRDERGRFGAGTGAGPTHGRDQPHGRVSKEHAPGPSAAFRAQVEAARARAAERGHVIEPAPTPPEDKPWRGEPGWTPGPDELSSESFATFDGSLHAPITPDDVVSGFRHEGVATWLKNEENRPAFAVHPMHAQLEGDTVRRGTYENGNNWPNGAIEISSDPSVMPEAGKGLPYGKTWTVSARAAYDGELTGTQASFAHELGHHIHLAGRTEPFNPSPHQLALHEQHLAIDSLVDAAYRRTGIGETVSGISVQRGEAMSPAVSRYALTNPHEYFAESFSGYIVDRDGLKAHDPNGYKMVRDVLKVRGIAP